MNEGAFLLDFCKLVSETCRLKQGSNRSSEAPIDDLAIIDVEIAAAPQASPQSGLTSTTWGKIKVSR